MLHWSNVCSLHVSGPVVSTVPTKQEELLLTHFKLVLVNRGLKSTNIMEHSYIMVGLLVCFLEIYTITR